MFHAGWFRVGTMEEETSMDRTEDFEGADPSLATAPPADGGFDMQAFADQVADFLETREAAVRPETPEGADAPPSGTSDAARVDALERAILDGEKNYSRLLADFQNLRNRASRDIQLGVEQTEKKIVLEILPVFDSFIRCLGSSYQDVPDFLTGVEMIERQFRAALRRLGVTEIELGAGDAFDAHVAEALSVVDPQDFPPGTIVEVCEKGFRMGERLLRPAKVVVTRGEGAD